MIKMKQFIRFSCKPSFDKHVISLLIIIFYQILVAYVIRISLFLLICNDIEANSISRLVFNKLTTFTVTYPSTSFYQKLLLSHQSQNAKRASSQKRHMVISIFLLCNSLILMSIGAGSIRAIKGGLDKVFKIRDRLHRICRQILR